MSSSTTIIVSEHPLVRERLRELLPRRAAGSARPCAGGMQQARQEILRTRPGLVLLDLHQNIPQGLLLIEELHRHLPETRVVAIVSADNPLYIERALAAGARGCLRGGEGAVAIRRAIARVMAGQDRVGGDAPRPRRRSVGRGTSAGRPAARAVARLTDRELQVLELLGQGNRTGRVAAELSLSRKTVETYYARLKQKLGLANGDELVKAAIRWTHAGAELRRKPRKTQKK